MTDQIHSHLYVFCSDRPRNGKTLLARLFCGYFPNTGPKQFHIFDTDFPEGNICSYFPQNSEVIDFGKTTGRVKLFDTIVGDPERSYVIDLQAEYLDVFFETYRNIEFDLEARASGIGTVVYYMQDRDSKSLQAAHDLEEKLNFATFFLVKNDAIEKRANYNPTSDLALSLDHIRSVRLPIVTDDLLNVLEHREFSLFEFMAGRQTGLPYDIYLEMWNLLDFFYGQRAPDKEGFTHFI
ncbi:MAG: hypothetical protein AAGA53_08845 [Pseudomonadota bacterium]